MKSDDSGIGRQGRRAEMVEGERRDTMPFEAAHPFFRPINQVLPQAVGEVGLLCREASECDLLFGKKVFPSKVKILCWKTKHRGVSDVWTTSEKSLVPLYPIVDDHQLIWLAVAEKIVDWACDNDVQVKEQGKSIKWHVLVENLEFTERAPSVRGRHRKVGKLNALDFFHNALGIIRVTNEADSPFQVTGNAAIELIDILWTV